MAFLTEQELENTIELPISLPLTSLAGSTLGDAAADPVEYPAAGDWLFAAHFQLRSPMVATVRWLQLTLLTISSEANIDQNYPDLGYVYAGLYKLREADGSLLVDDRGVAINLSQTTPAGAAAVEPVLVIEKPTPFVLPVTSSRNTDTPLVLDAAADPSKAGDYAFIIANNTDAPLAASLNGMLRIKLVGK